MSVSLLSAWPVLRERLDWVSLGQFPTPIERLSALERELGRDALFVKRDDLSSPIYGGNKVRTLEALFARARAAGAREIYATGAYGSNHAVATALHAARAGLVPGAVLFAQPESSAALENLRVSFSYARRVVAAPHWSLLPFALWRAQAPGRVVMAPGGATPEGALGYVAAALELGAQIARGAMPEPGMIVVGIGSTCTTAGLLVGLAHAARLGLGFRAIPLVLAVRVTPWPVTSRHRVLDLATRTSRLLAMLTDEPSLALGRADLARHLCIDGRELGAGYGRASTSGSQAIEIFRNAGLFELDTTYSGKAAAGFLRRAREAADTPLLFWSTKSTAPLPEPRPESWTHAPGFVRRWIQRAEALVPLAQRC